jgi:olefin beta-lactone synthetase
MSNFNVAQLLSDRVQANPDGRCLVWSEKGIDRVLTYAEVERQTDAYAHGLRTFGVRAGDRVLLMERPGPRFIGLVWAMFKLGAVPVLIDPGMGLPSLLRCVEKLRPDVLVGVKAAHLLRTLNARPFSSVRRAISTDGRWIGASPLWRLEDPVAGRFTPHQTREDALAAILFTSGSTGPAKGVEYRHSVFAAQAAALQSMFDFQPGEVDMPGFPLFALFSTALGLTCVLPQMHPSRPALADPARLLRQIQDWRVNNLQGSPAIWERLGRYCRDLGIRLPFVRRVITFGAPISVGFLEMWQRILDADANVYTPYGATEALPISLIRGADVLADTATDTRNGAGTCVGRPVARTDVRIIETSDEPIAEWNDSLLLPPGQIGEIVVAGEQVTWAYDGEPLATQASKIQNGSQIWHRTGDLGYLDGTGRLWIVSRKAHRVEGPQQFYYPVCAEGIADQHPDVLRSALVGVGAAGQQRPVLVVELRKPELFADMAERNRVAREVKEKLAAHPVYKDVNQVLFHKAFPVDPRHNAKIDRSALAEWASGEKLEPLKVEVTEGAAL